MRTLAIAAAAALSLVTTSSADAADLIPDLDIGIGIIGYSAGNFLDKPDKNEQGIVYPGFAGFGAGGGFMFDFKVLDIVGLEIDVIFTDDRGSGEINDIDVTIGQDATHVPVLLKVGLPFGIARPNFAIGMDFVFPDKAEVDSDIPNIDAKAKAYQLLTIGLGLELVFPTHPIDIRIPISVRGQFNLDTPDDVLDRVDLDSSTNTIIYTSEWKFHIAATLGIAIYL